MFKTIIITPAGEKIQHNHETLIEACLDADEWEACGCDAGVTQHYLNEVWLA